MRTSVLTRVDARGLSGRNETPGQMIDAALYRELIVSHRRMERLNDATQHLRGLRDLDTGEIFLIDERRLFDARR
jgi:hypothetical protein